MENKSAMTFTLSIVALILGVALFKKFDFDTLKFENPRLAIVYGVTFIVSISILIKNFIKKDKGNPQA